MADKEEQRTGNRRYKPWYVIPANLKSFRNWAIAQIIVSTLERIKLKFPEPKIDVSRFVIE